MGGGDLNAKKAWHPNTLKNQERVWKAEQAAAEEKKRITELERERLLERDRAELNKLAKSNMAHSSQNNDDRLHWMYEKPDKKVQQEEYLLGKAIDKSQEQPGKSDADEIPAVSRRVVGSSMLTVSGDTQVDLARKMREDPLLLVKERERAARAALLNNPVQRAKLAELLRKDQAIKKESKPKDKKKKSKNLDNILAEKLQALSGNKGIDLASLLASDDSSSESSDEKTKKKKKKKKKKSKKNVKSDDEGSVDRKHKSKHDSSKDNKQKQDDIESDSDNDKRKKKHHSMGKESTKSRARRHHRDSSEDNQSSDDMSSDDLKEQKRKSKYSRKNETKKVSSSDKLRVATSKSSNVDVNRKKRQHSVENDSAESHVKNKKQQKYSKDDHHSSDEQQSMDDRLNENTRNYVKENRYWDHEQYSSSRYTRDAVKDDKYARTKGETCDDPKEKYSRDNRQRHEREDRQRIASSYRYRNESEDTYKNEKDKGRTGTNETDKNWRGNKRSGLSEAEKAAKLAEMVAAGAEREKQRERRVAHQLAEKEIEDRPNKHARSYNVPQLPDSLQSRLHSNRHYIQRDQRHMNENFAKR